MPRSTTKSNTNFLDLSIKPTRPKAGDRLMGKYRICTLTKGTDGQKYINLRLPDNVQESILSAYAEGKTVRIFS